MTGSLLCASDDAPICGSAALDRRSNRYWRYSRPGGHDVQARQARASEIGGATSGNPPSARLLESSTRPGRYGWTFASMPPDIQARPVTPGRKDMVKPNTRRRSAGKWPSFGRLGARHIIALQEAPD